MKCKSKKASSIYCLWTKPTLIESRSVLSQINRWIIATITWRWNKELIFPLPLLQFAIDPVWFLSAAFWNWYRRMWVRNDGVCAIVELERLLAVVKEGEGYKLSSDHSCPPYSTSKFKITAQKIMDTFNVMRTKEQRNNENTMDIGHTLQASSSSTLLLLIKAHHSPLLHTYNVPMTVPMAPQKSLWGAMGTVIGIGSIIKVRKSDGIKWWNTMCWHNLEIPFYFSTDHYSSTIHIVWILLHIERDDCKKSVR